MTDDIIQMIKDCRDQALYMSEEEVRFIDHIAKEESLSTGQGDRLDRIWDRVAAV